MAVRRPEVILCYKRRLCCCAGAAARERPVWYLGRRFRDRQHVQPVKPDGVGISLFGGYVNPDYCRFAEYWGTGLCRLRYYWALRSFWLCIRACGG
jgi:hypothetical protein